MHSKFPVAISLALVLSASVHGQQPVQSQQDMPWPVKLGVRVATAQAARPVAPIVVLVPDDATYLREVGRWSMNAQWPVLFEDDELAPLFIRAFKPAKVVRVPAAEPLPSERDLREQAMHSVVARSWGGDEGESPVEAFAKLKWLPPGVAVADATDPAWPAAVALAAGRGLPIAFLDGEFGQSGVVLAPSRMRKLKDDLAALVAELGYSWEKLGDDLDAVALCRSLAARTSLEPDARARNIHADRHKGPYAVTDVLCRHNDGSRWAIAGWIWGSNERAAYMAMCSLFLDRTKVLFFNGYDTRGGRENYEVVEVTEASQNHGYDADMLRGTDGDLASWLRLDMGGLDVDALVANSSGRPHEFSLTGRTKGHAIDVPLLARPLALHLVHSYSLQRPADLNTVGGRFLDHGVYAYVGSVEEPYLGAFIPPTLFLNRMFNFVPFLVAGRSWDGPFSTIWRVTTIGDPLMLMQPPPRRKIQRAEMPSIPNAIDLQDVAREYVIALRESPRAAPEAIETLVLLGRDDMAARVWRATRGDSNLDSATRAAPMALGPLFRQRRFDEFLRAFDRLPAGERTGIALDMLWHFATPRLETMDDVATLGLLLSSARGPDPSIDLARLLPHVERVIGAGAGRSAIERALQVTTSEKVRTALKRLLQPQN